VVLVEANVWVGNVQGVSSRWDATNSTTGWPNITLTVQNEAGLNRGAGMWARSGVLGMLLSLLL
jgi:hypothetical protein